MKKALLLPLVLLLAACGTAKQPLYYWDKYPDTVYQGMQAKLSPDQQISTLEQYLEKPKPKIWAVGLVLFPLHLPRPPRPRWDLVCGLFLETTTL